MAMWTAKNRRGYDRSKLRYPSDLTNEEWARVEPLIPGAKIGGNKRRVNVREVVNGIMYILSTGCQWRAIPKDLPPRSTLFDYLDLWHFDGTLARMHHELYVECRKRGERQASPTAAIIDSQSVKSAEKSGACIDPSGYDAGKKIKGKKRHILVDTLGLLLHAIIHPANVQDRDGGILLLSTPICPFLEKLFADGGYQGVAFRKELAETRPGLEIEIVKRPDHAKGFVPLPRRWIVERTIAWLNRCRRLTKDWENLNRKALTFLLLASIRFMLRKLCNPT
jgi:transposase